MRTSAPASLPSAASAIAANQRTLGSSSYSSGSSTGTVDGSPMAPTVRTADVRMRAESWPR